MGPRTKAKGQIHRGWFMKSIVLPNGKKVHDKRRHNKGRAKGSKNTGVVLMRWCPNCGYRPTTKREMKRLRKIFFNQALPGDRSEAPTKRQEFVAG